MRSKKMLILIAAVLMIAFVGCTESNVSINDTYTITVCEKTSDTVISAEGIKYEVGESTINRAGLKQGDVFEVYSTHFVIEEAEDRYVINRVIRQTEDTPEACL